jgi:hypothetical protein
MASLMRRTLMRTSAPIFSSLRRIVPQVASANCVCARPRELASPGHIRPDRGCSWGRLLGLQGRIEARAQHALTFGAHNRDCSELDRIDSVAADATALLNHNGFATGRPGEDSSLANRADRYSSESARATADSLFGVRLGPSIRAKQGASQDRRHITGILSVQRCRDRQI